MHDTRTLVLLDVKTITVISFKFHIFYKHVICKGIFHTVHITFHRSNTQSLFLEFSITAKMPFIYHANTRESLVNAV